MKTHSVWFHAPGIGEPQGMWHLDMEGTEAECIARLAALYLVYGVELRKGPDADSASPDWRKAHREEIYG